MIDAYWLHLTPAEFKWLLAFLATPEARGAAEAAGIIKKAEDLAKLDKPKRESP